VIPVAQVCRKAGIHPAAYFSRKDGLPPTAMWRLMQLEDENAKPNKVVTDPSLDTAESWVTGHVVPLNSSITIPP
jgi:putative transposase